MTYFTKYWASIGVTALVLAMAIRGIDQIKEEGLRGVSKDPGAMLLFTSVAVGLIASIGTYYFRSKRSQDMSNAERVGVETLAKLGRKSEKNDKN